MYGRHSLLSKYMICIFILCLNNISHHGYVRIYLVTVLFLDTWVVLKFLMLGKTTMNVLVHVPSVVVSLLF